MKLIIFGATGTVGKELVKQAVEKHKGKIMISDNEPKGTVFTITFQSMT